MYGTVVSSCAYVISETGEVVTPGATQLPGYHYPITTNASYSSQQSNIQPQGIMQMQQPVLQAQQAGTPLPCKCRILLYAGSTGCWHGANDNKVATAHHDDDTVFDESSSKRSCHQPNNRPSYRYINPPLYLNNNNNKQVEWVHLYQAFC